MFMFSLFNGSMYSLLYHSHPHVKFHILAPCVLGCFTFHYSKSKGAAITYGTEQALRAPGA